MLLRETAVPDTVSRKLVNLVVHPVTFSESESALLQGWARRECVLPFQEPCARFIHDSTCCDAPRLSIREVLPGRASSPAIIDQHGESGCGALGRETPRRQDLEPSRDGRVMNNPG